MSFFISLTLLTLLAFILHSVWNCKPTASIFVSMCLTILIVAFSGMINLLFPAVILYMLGIVLSVLFLLYKKGVAWAKEQLKSFFSPALCIFYIAVFICAIIFALNPPGIIYWDEFAVWATVAKVMTVSNQLYTLAPGNLMFVVTPSAMAFLSYFFQFFASSFSESLLFLSQIAFTFSVYAMVCELLWENTKKLSSTVLTFLSLFFIPFLFLVNEKVIVPTHVVRQYTTAMPDLQVTACFAAIIILYLLHPDKKWFLFPVVISSFVKDVGFTFGMIGAGVLFLLWLFSQQNRKQLSFFKWNGWKALFPVTLVSIFAPLANYLVWTIHTSLALNRNQFVVGGEENMGMVDMLFTGIRELLFPSNRSTKFSGIFSDMITRSISNKMSVFGSGFSVILLCCLLCMLTYFLTSKSDRLQVLTLSMGILVGFALYFIFLGFNYIYVFRGGEGELLAEFDRYFNTYYTAWLFLAISIFVTFSNRFPKITTLFLNGVSFVLSFVFVFYVGTMHSFIGASNYRFASRYTLAEATGTINRFAHANEKVFIISQEDHGQIFLELTYSLYPILINNSDTAFGETAGRLVVPGSAFESDMYAITITPEELSYLLQSEFDYLFLHDADEEFFDSYGHLFADDLSYYYDHDIRLYKVIINENGPVLYPCLEEAAIYA